MGNEHRSAAKAMPGFGDGGTCTEIIVSLQTGCLFTGCLFTGCLFTGCLFGVRIGIGIGIGKIGI